MKALVYRGPGKVAVEDKPKPELIDSTDAVVKLTLSTICGTDLHIVKGDVPTCKPGTTLGHEGTGVVEKVGASVKAFKVGDRVIIACITSCSSCDYCRKSMPSHCATGGWILGNTIEGTQAEYVRIPHADASLHPIPKGADEAAMVMISDILPTGYECGTLNGKVQPGSSVAIVGSGPVGLAALMTALLYSPSIVIMIDQDTNRLAVAKKLGATHTIEAGASAVKQVMDLTGNIGVDTAIEAVGVPPTFELCQEIIAPGGTIANVGVHGSKVDLHLETLWSKNISITTRLVDHITGPTLLKLAEAGRLHPGSLITHDFAFSKVTNAYDTFGAAAANKALKVIIKF